MCLEQGLVQLIELAVSPEKGPVFQTLPHRDVNLIGVVGTSTLCLGQLYLRNGYQEVGAER